MLPDATITTERLTLRPFQESDIDATQRAGDDPLTQTWLPLPSPYTREMAAQWCRDGAREMYTAGRALVRAIELDGELAGCIDLKRIDERSRSCEIGYWTVPAARGRGVMVEAVTGLARWVLAEMAYQRVELRIAPGNAASLRVAEKAGFVREGVARNAGFVHAGRADLEIWSLIPADLGRSTARSAA
jgi:RimJ/RimL family protein N-acetyltransferase